MNRILVTVLATVILTACKGSYLTHFSEGNIIEPQSLGEIEVGMTKQEVADHMGSPVYDNLFRQNRWVYIHHVRNGSSHTMEEVAFDFDHNRLAHITKKPGDLKLRG